MNKFFWGNSVSSMQTEGGWNEDGKSKSVYDIRPATEKVSDWHFANDNYHHFDVDLDLMLSLIHISEPTRLSEASRMPSSA